MTDGLRQMYLINAFSSNYSCIDSPMLLEKKPRLAQTKKNTPFNRCGCDLNARVRPFGERDLNVGCQFAMCIENGQNWPHTDGLTRSAQPRILFDNLIINLHNNIGFDWMAHVESNRKTNTPYTHTQTAARATVIGCVFAMGAQMRIYFFLIVVINRFGAPRHGFLLRNTLNQFNANLFSCLCVCLGLLVWLWPPSKVNRMERMLLRAYAIDPHAARVMAFTFDLLVSFFSLSFLSFGCGLLHCN